MTRLRMSRPRRSVPNGYWALGASWRWRTLSAIGSCGEITSASSAIRTSSRVSASPLSTSLLAASSRSGRRRGAARSAGVATAGASAWLSAIADAGIEDRVEQVDDKVDQHERHRHAQHRPLDDRVVAAVDAPEEQAAEAGQ